MNVQAVTAGRLDDRYLRTIFLVGVGLLPVLFVEEPWGTELSAGARHGEQQQPDAESVPNCGDKTLPEVPANFPRHPGCQNTVMSVDQPTKLFRPTGYAARSAATQSHYGRPADAPLPSSIATAVPVGRRTGCGIPIPISVKGLGKIISAESMLWYTRAANTNRENSCPSGTISVPWRSVCLWTERSPGVC